jgi:hypothetical protein
VFHHHPANTTFRPAPPKRVRDSTCQPKCLNNDALTRLKERADFFMQLKRIKTNALNRSLEVRACMLFCARFSETACQVDERWKFLMRTGCIVKLSKLQISELNTLVQKETSGDVEGNHLLRTQVNVLKQSPTSTSASCSSSKSSLLFSGS